MYAVSVQYKVPVTELEKLAELHVEWVRAQYEAGHFLVSGPQRPRTGGFILAKAMPREQLDEILAEDPYVKAGNVIHKIVEFCARFTDPLIAMHAEEQ